MGMFCSPGLGLAMVFSLVGGWTMGAYGQSLPHTIDDDLAQLERAICLGQWQEAIDITSGLMASEEVSPDYRQELLGVRRQLQVWQTSSLPPQASSSCDRTQSLFITLDQQPTAPEPQPLDWNRALATLANRRPIIELNDDIEPTANLIPAELTANSPELLTAWANPLDTTHGFNVTGGRVNGDQQVYSFLARLGDRVSLELDVTRTYIGGDSQLFVFDQDGRLLTQSDPDSLQASIQDFALPQTDVYFAVVSPQGTLPVVDAHGLITDWQISDGTSFDYTLTLTGVTPYQALLP
ncbi:hypothetical protein [Leptothoe sp. PORK10 BA2]|uniref:hypothetical protein n=1 Tax=Leptothoe sp. PORK10 BA2 TaxID=3110254 RepID=UPI002B1EBC02|nr:hypothetical protein [Leptothoe sp. PORK10 BA2]MEA5465302.1 hypothetical protein [Leptothoe sp. PORK10 BA2]